MISPENAKDDDGDEDENDDDDDDDDDDKLGTTLVEDKGSV